MNSHTYSRNEEIIYDDAKIKEGEISKWWNIC